MTYFKISISYNYCGGDIDFTLFSTQGFTENEVDAMIIHLLDELAAEGAVESFGCNLGDFISDDDEEEGNEELEAHVSITELEEGEISDFHTPLDLRVFMHNPSIVMTM